MRADREDRLTEDTERRHSTQTLLTAIAVLILAGAAYLLAPGDDDEPEADEPPTAAAPAAPVPEPPQPDPTEVIRSAPDIPEPVDTVEVEPAAPAEDSTEAPAAETARASEEAAPPTPEQLDARLREAIAATDVEPAQVIAPSFNAPYLLDRGVSSVDQLARGLVPRRTLNLPRPKGAFTTTREGQEYRLDPASYRRYDPIVAAITALPTDTLADLFQRFRPELTDAYASLGYPPDAMDNTLIAALDAVIAAPVRDDPPQLVSKGALWAYADTTLEKSSDLHRQLLRAGPKNTRALQAWAQQLRDSLLNP